MLTLRKIHHLATHNTMTKYLRFALCLAFSTGLRAGPAPADPDASPRTKAVLSYLHTLPFGTKDRVLLGQFLGYPNRNEIPGNSFSLAPATEVFERTGKWPALVGADYSGRTVLDYTNHRDLNYESINPALKA